MGPLCSPPLRSLDRSLVSALSLVGWCLVGWCLVAWCLVGWCSPAAAASAPRAGFGWPVEGVPVVERRFDPPATAYGAGHRGVDLQADLGQEVLAAGAGQVTYAGLLAGRGVVTVTHVGGLRTTYEPVVSRVRVGQRVALGEVLGSVATGHAACRRATCLHWGLKRGDAYLDPLALVDAGPVRLLPLGAPVQAVGPAVRARPGTSTTAAPAAERAGDEQRPPHRGAPGVSRGVQAVVAVGSLVVGTALLVRPGRPASPEPSPRAPPAGTQPEGIIDLGAERGRRRPA